MAASTAAATCALAFWFAHMVVMANAVVGLRRLYRAWSRWLFGALCILAAAMEFEHGGVVARSGGGALFDGAVSAEYWSSTCGILLFQTVSRVVSFFRLRQRRINHFVQGEFNRRHGSVGSSVQVDECLWRISTLISVSTYSHVSCQPQSRDFRRKWVLGAQKFSPPAGASGGACGGLPPAQISVYTAAGGP